MTANDAPMHIGEVFREMLEAKPVTVTLPGSIRSKKNSKRVFKHDLKRDHICKSCGQGAIRRPGIGLCDNCFNRHQRAAKREARA
jgi:hypothetical protein